MPKPVPSRLRRLLAFALPACAVSLSAQRVTLAQRPDNALPPRSNGTAPTDDYYKGQAPYPVTTPAPDTSSAAPPNALSPRAPSTLPGAAPEPTVENPARTPQAENATDDTLAAFLRSEAGGAPLKLSQARAGWRTMRIVRSGEASSAQQPRSATRPRTERAPGSGGVLWSTVVSRFAGKPGVFLTRGRTLKLNGDDHLLVYQAQFPSAAEVERWMSAQFPRGTSAPSLSEMTRSMRTYLGAIPLRASLVNTRQVAAMEDIEPFDFQSRFSSLSRDLEDGFRDFQARSSADSTPNSGSQSPGATQIVPPAQIPIPPATVSPTRPSEGTTTPRIAEEPPRAVPVPDAVAQQAASEPLRRLFAAVQRYRADNGDVLPPLDDLTRAQGSLAPYLSGQDPWRDPVSGRFFVPNSRLSVRRMVHLKPFASSLILFYSEPDASGKRTVLRLDGIIRRVSPGEWEKLNGTAGVQ